MCKESLQVFVFSVVMCIIPAVLADTNVLTNPGFENGTTGWSARGGTFSTVTLPVYSGSRSGRCTNRSDTWQGIKQSILGKINTGQTVMMSGWVRLEDGATDAIKLTVEQRDGSGTRYIPVDTDSGRGDQWTLLSGPFTLSVSGTLTYLDVYFEGPASGIDLYVDDAAVMVPESGSGEAAATINPASRHQMIEGFGAAGAWYESMLTGHPQRNELYNILFRDLGLDIYRVRNTFEIDSGYMDRSAQIIAGAEAALGRPIKVMISSWSPPAYLKSNNNTREGTLKKDGSGNYMYPEFATWWYNSLLSWQSRGVTADYINIQNEPDYVNSGWDTCYLLATETSTNAGYPLAFETVYQKLAYEMGEAMPLMLASETTGHSAIANYINNLVDRSHAYGYAHHLYNCENGGSAGCADEPDLYLTMMANFGAAYGYKPLFQTEYEGSSGAWPDAFNVALLMHNSLVVEGVSAYVYWDLFWNSGGLVTLTSNSYTINSDYWGFKHYSAFIDYGWRRIEATADNANVRISAYINPENNQLTAVIINTSQTMAYDLDLSFPQTTIDSGQVYRTSASENCVLIGAFDGTQPLSVPARSVTTVAAVVSLVPTTCAQVIDYNYRMAEDLDGDCAVEFDDLMVMAGQWLSGTPEAIAPNYSPDLAVDNRIDIKDLAMLTAQWMTCNDPQTAGCEANWMN